MLEHTPNAAARLLLPPFLLLFSCVLSGQPATGDSLRYDGPYTVGDYQGMAEYVYRLAEGDTLMNGPFRMRGSNLSALLSGGDGYFSFTGEMRDNRPDSSWRLNFGDYMASGDSKVEDYRYLLSVDGTEHRAAGSIGPDGLRGRWVQEVRRIENSEPRETLFSSEVDFADGTPQQSFRIESGDDVLLGRFTRDGLAHDVWTLYSDIKTAQNWYFRDGRLERIELDVARDTTAVPIFSPPTDRTTTTNLDVHYFELVEIWQRMAGREGTDISGRAAARLLIANADHYNSVLSVLRALGSEDRGPLFKVTVPEFPLSQREVARLETIGTYLERIDTLTQSLLDNTSLSIIENSDAQVAGLRAELQNLRGDFLAPVREIHELYVGDVLRHLPREEYLTSLYPSGEAAYGDLRAFDISGRGLAAVEDATAFALTRVDSIERVLGGKLNTRERQQVLTALEEQLMFEFSQLDSLIDAQDRRLSRRYKLAGLKKAARAELAQYSAIDNVLEKRRRAGELTDCIETMEALTITLATLPARQEEIEDLYTNEVWNNFTATVMEEEIKKRIIRAYRDDLIPYFLDRLEGPLNCGEAERLNTQLTVLHQRMETLRDQDTDELEDELRGTDDPREILQLLNVNAPLEQ